MSTATATSNTAYQILPLDCIHESTTNPRRTFDPDKLAELADSLRTHGLIQPITVRPNAEGFEIVAGARRFRAAKLAELAEVPARILTLTDAQALEIQIVENAQREDVHPYEEAAGYQRLLDLPGYDVTALALKCGKSPSHVYARLTLLQLSPEVAEAFQQDRITAAHANLIARLTPEQQAQAFEQCFFTPYSSKDPALVPSRTLSTWIQNHLYLPLATAPFPTDDPGLRPDAGPCTTCPRRSGHNTALFADLKGDQCFDHVCYENKVTAFIDREIGAHPEYVHIEDSWRPVKEQRPTQLRNDQYWPVKDVDDAQPVCASIRTALVVYGRSIGHTFPVCIDRECFIHDPRQAARRKADPPPVPPPPTPGESAEAEAARIETQERRQADYLANQERIKEEYRLKSEQEDREAETNRERRELLKKQREATFERIVATVPPTLTAPQLRVVLRALVNMDPFTFADDLAVALTEDDENDQRSADEVLLTTIDRLTDDKLTGFAVHLALAGHRGIPRANEFDFLTEAEIAFAPQPPPSTKKTPATPAKRTTAKAAAKKTGNSTAPSMAAQVATANTTKKASRKR